MSFEKTLNVQEYVYDFAKDGGATGEIFLSSKAGYDPIPVGAVIFDVIAYVETAVVGNSSTLAWGNDDDPDGYMVATAEASLGANVTVRAGEAAGALLWDDTNDHMLAPYVANEDDGEFSVTIGNANLTAGKVRFYVLYLMTGTNP